MTKRRQDEAQTAQHDDDQPARKPTLESYNAVVERAELKIIRLVDLNFKVRPESEKRRDKLPQLYYDIAEIETHYHPTEGQAGLLLLFNAGVKRGRAKPVDCTARFFVVYKGLQGCEKDAVIRFLTRVGRFAAYPYFRSLFSVLTWNAQVNMPPLPVLKEASRPKATISDSEARRSGKLA